MGGIHRNGGFGVDEKVDDEGLKSRLRFRFRFDEDW